MGDWKISITGIGSHHNKSNTTDADKMVIEFIKQLKSSGHNIRTATFESINNGIIEDITPHNSIKE